VYRQLGKMDDEARAAFQNRAAELRADLDAL
jgi:hypothetical protein